MGGPPEQKNVNTTALYDLMGVDKKATSSEIKKAFFKLARTEHPDKGGDYKKVRSIAHLP